jgi:hypothetical protein
LLWRKLLIHFCCECSFCNVQIEIDEDLRKRLSQLKAPIASRERQSRGITQKKAWCSLWHLAVDPLDKACYKWQNTLAKRIEEKFHFHSPLPSSEMSNHKTLYKYKLKHQKLGESTTTHRKLPTKNQQRKPQQKHQQTT